MNTKVFICLVVVTDKFLSVAKLNIKIPLFVIIVPIVLPKLFEKLLKELSLIIPLFLFSQLEINDVSPDVYLTISVLLELIGLNVTSCVFLKFYLRNKHKYLDYKKFKC